VNLKSIVISAAACAAALGGAPTYAGQHETKSLITAAAVSRRVPKGFHSYLSTPVGENTRCVAGKVADQDGMHARPYVYLSTSPSGSVQWARFLDMPKDYYEGRATHCLSRGDDLYVLLQLDTQAPRSLSQTLLSIVKVRMSDGAIEGHADVPVPEARAAYTSWVWDDDGFKRVGEEFEIKGQYRYMDAEDDLPFSALVKM